MNNLLNFIGLFALVIGISAVAAVLFIIAIFIVLYYQDKKEGR